MSQIRPIHTNYCTLYRYQAELQSSLYTVLNCYIAGSTITFLQQIGQSYLRGGPYPFHSHFSPVSGRKQKSLGTEHLHPSGCYKAELSDFLPLLLLVMYIICSVYYFVNNVNLSFCKSIF